jgi:hypothetical protein
VVTPQGKYFKDAVVNLRSDLPAGRLPAEIAKVAGRAGMPDYQDADGDGYPENREVSGKGRKRLVVGFRSSSHAGSSLPITAEGVGALFFTGYFDQTDIFFRSAQALTENTAAMDELLDHVRRKQSR